MEAFRATAGGVGAATAGAGGTESRRACALSVARGLAPHAAARSDRAARTVETRRRIIKEPFAVASRGRPRARARSGWRERARAPRDRRAIAAARSPEAPW